MAVRMDVQTALQRHFQRAVEIIQSLPPTSPIQPTYDQKLSLYSLYKQSIEGDIDTVKDKDGKGRKRPGMLDMAGRVKWDAWSRYKGMSKEEAMSRYIQLLVEILQPHSSEPGVSSFLTELSKFTDLEKPERDVRGGGVDPETGTHERGRRARRERSRSSSASSSSSRSFISSKSSISGDSIPGSGRDVPETKMNSAPPHPHEPSTSSIPFASDAEIDADASDADSGSGSDSSIALGGDAASHRASRVGSVTGMVGMGAGGGGGRRRRRGRKDTASGIGEEGIQTMRAGMRDAGLEEFQEDAKGSGGLLPNPTIRPGGPTQSRPISPIPLTPLLSAPFVQHPLGPSRHANQPQPSPFGVNLSTTAQYNHSNVGTPFPSRPGSIAPPPQPPRVLPFSHEISSAEQYNNQLNPIMYSALQQVQTSLTALHERLSSLEHSQAIILADWGVGGGLGGGGAGGVMSPGGRRRGSSAGGGGGGGGLIVRLLGMMGFPGIIWRSSITQLDTTEGSHRFQTNLTQEELQGRPRSPSEIHLERAQLAALRRKREEQRLVEEEAIEAGWRRAGEEGVNVPIGEEEVGVASRRAKTLREGGRNGVVGSRGSAQRSLPLKVVFALLKLLRRLVVDGLSLLLLSAVISIAIGISRRRDVRKLWGEGYKRLEGVMRKS